MTYCFKCPECGYRVQQSVREPAPTHFHSWKGPTTHGKKREWRMVRDWRAEAMNVNVEGLRG